MPTTHFSGPVESTNGFVIPVTTTANLPTASASNQGRVILITDNGVGNNEYCLVVSTGSAWVTAVGAALS